MAKCPISDRCSMMDKQSPSLRHKGIFSESALGCSSGGVVALGENT